MQEDTRVEGDTVIVPPGLKRGANSRAAGEDLRAKSVMLPAGRRLTTTHVALAAAVGLTDIAGAPPRADRGVLDRRRDRRTRPAAAAGRAVRRQPLPARRLDRAHGRELHRPRHPARRQGAARAAPSRMPPPTTTSCSPPAASPPARPITSARGREHRQAGVLAGRHQARPAGGDGRDRGRRARARAPPSSVCPAIRSRCS